MLTAAKLSTLPGIAHGFFTRRGGVSEGIYSSLNTGLGSTDDRDNVAENRGRICDAVGVDRDRLATPYQVHSATAILTDTGWAPGTAPKGDAVVTATPGLAVAVGTADCGSLLFADADAGIVAAAHAGWRGALAGITDATIAAMEDLGAIRERIFVALGPMISQPSYEVGPEMRAQFLDADGLNKRFFIASARDSHFMFDLPGYLRHRLEHAGLDHIEDLARCTYREDALFFSYRRATHKGEPDYGRLMSAIAIVA